MIEKSIDDDVFAQDIERAQSEWQGEEVIWLLPDADRTFRWTDGPVNKAVIPSEAFNILTVYHVDTDRRVYPFPPGLGTRRLPQRWYKKWLDKSPKFLDSDVRQVTVDVPVDEGRRTESRTIENPLPPIMPITGVVEDPSLLVTSWPLAGQHGPRTVSPESETVRRFGLWNGDYAPRQTDGGIVIPVARPVTMKWPRPFNKTFPSGGSLDTLHSWALMRSLIARSGEGQRDEVQREVEARAGRFTSPGQSTVELAIFLPEYVSTNEEKLKHLAWRVGDQLRVETTSFEELRALPAFETYMTKPVPVRRFVSWLGYFWWEFYQDLQSQETIKMCERCGKILVGGRKDRQNCGQENMRCVRERGKQATRRCRKRKGPTP